MNLLKTIQKLTGAYFNFLAYVHSKLLAKKGFSTFCNPFSRKLKPHMLAFLEKNKDEIIEIDGNKIQTYKWGEGSKHILLLHGWASHSYRWKKNIHYLLKNDFTIHAFDAPAHGLSEGKIMHVKIYEKVIREYLKNNESVNYIMAHSIGGFATTYYLSENKEHQIKKVIIMGAPGEAKDFFNFYKSTLGLSEKATQIIINQFVIELGEKPEYFSSKRMATHNTIPALIVHDKEDKAANSKYSVGLHENWKNSQLLLTNGLGHDLKSEELIKYSITFLVN
jgi:pimeloyl-ACP methyl ester carboxylesterase